MVFQPKDFEMGAEAGTMLSRIVEEKILKEYDENC